MQQDDPVLSYNEMLFHKNRLTIIVKIYYVKLSGNMRMRTIKYK